MRKFTVSLLLFSALTTISAPASAAQLHDLLAKLDKHPRVASAKASLDSAEAAKQEAFSGYLPTVDLAAGGGHETVDRTDLSPAGARTSETASSYSASVRQNLFQGFGTQAAVHSADVNAQAAQLNVDATHQQILYEGASAFLEVMRFVELTQLANDNQDNLREQLNLEDERVKRGSGIAVDALQAKSRLQVSRERYTAFMGGLKDAISRYTQVFNETPTLETMQLPKLPTHLVPATMEEAIAKALSNNPQYANAKENVELASTARTSAKVGYYPNVDLVGASSYDDSVSGVLGEEVDHSVKLETSWQVFSGFADQSRVRQAGHNYRAAVENSEFTGRKIVEEVKLAWSSLTTSKERNELLENAVNIAGEVYDARKRLRDAGSETAINVLDAENELYRARIDAASARYDYYLAVYRLLAAMGAFSVESIS